MSFGQLRISLAIFAALGTISLFLADSIAMPESVTVQEAKELPIGKKISVQGKATNTFIVKNTLFFTLTDNFGNTIKIVKFFPNPKDTLLANETGFVIVIGTTQLYKGEEEIIAQEVKKIE